MKYLLFNDIKNIFKDKSFKVIFVTLLLEFIFQFIIVDDNIIDLLLGRNFKDIKYYISTLFFLLHILLFTYVVLNVYLKDMTYNLDNIFLRLKPIKFVCEKIIIVFFSVIILRALEYILIIPIIIKNSYSLMILITYYMKDILFYMTFSLFIIFSREYKWLIGDKSIILFVIYTLIVPKNIDVSYLQYFIIIIILIGVTIISMNVFIKKIIESEGGSK